jgi:hypothetical protein
MGKSSPSAAVGCLAGNIRPTAEASVAVYSVAIERKIARLQAPVSFAEQIGSAIGARKPSARKTSPSADDGAKLRAKRLRPPMTAPSCMQNVSVRR